MKNATTFIWLILLTAPAWLILKTDLAEGRAIYIIDQPVEQNNVLTSDAKPVHRRLNHSANKEEGNNRTNVEQNKKYNVSEDAAWINSSVSAVGNDTQNKTSDSLGNSRQYSKEAAFMSLLAAGILAVLFCEGAVLPYMKRLYRKWQMALPTTSGDHSSYGEDDESEEDIGMHELRACLWSKRRYGREFQIDWL